MLHLLKDLQEEVITSDIHIDENRQYSFEVEHIGHVTIVEHGDQKVKMVTEIQGENQTYIVSPIEAFNLIPALSLGQMIANTPDEKTLN